MAVAPLFGVGVLLIQVAIFPHTGALGPWWLMRKFEWSSSIGHMTRGERAPAHQRVRRVLGLPNPQALRELAGV